MLFYKWIVKTSDEDIFWRKKHMTYWHGSIIIITSITDIIIIEIVPIIVNMTQKLQYDIYKIMVLKQGNVIHQTVSNQGAFREKKLFYSKTNVSTGPMKHNIRAYIYHLQEYQPPTKKIIGIHTKIWKSLSLTTLIMGRYITV